MIFAIHQHKSAMGVYVFPHPKPASYLPPHTMALGFPRALALCPASCIKLALVIYFTYGNIHLSVLFSQIIPPSPSPTEPKSLFFTSVSLAALHVGSSLPSLPSEPQV